MSAVERRSQIVRAALRLFSEKGFRATTTRALASAVGVTEPVLYEHFPSKRDLYRAIVELKARERLDDLTAAVASLAKSDDDESFLKCFADTILDRMLEDPATVRLTLFIALDGDEMAETLRDHQAQPALELLAAYLERRAAEGALRRVDAQLAARAFHAMVVLQGIRIIVFRDPIATERRREMVDLMVGLFLEGLRCRERQGSGAKLRRRRPTPPSSSSGREST